MRETFTLAGRGLRFLPLLLIFFCVGVGLARASSDAQTCRDVGVLTFCADEFIEYSSSVNGGGFKLRGNLVIGPKGQPPVVAVDNIGSVFDGSILDSNISIGSYFHFNQADPNTGTTDFILGDVRMINDVTGLTLLGTSVVTFSASSEVRVGRLFVNPTTGKIFNPAAGAVPIFVQDGIPRNANIRLAFITRAGALSFFKGGGTVPELSVVDAEFDILNKRFSGTIPVNLNLSGASATDNADLNLTLRANFSDSGAFTGAVDGFKAKLAGLLVEAKNIVLRVWEFEAAVVDISKADNPGLPNLDPTNANLVFRFEKLLYKNGQFSIGGVTTPIKDFVFGDAFSLVNQSLGLLADNQNQTLFFSINTTLRFGAVATSQTTVPVVLKISRKVVNGQPKPIFEAGLQNISPKLGTFTANLTGVTLAGDAAENFFGIKATTAALQWPAAMGGKTAAGVGGFKLGINKDRGLVFALANGTIGTPEFESAVLKGSLAGTVSANATTVTFVLSGTLNLKLAQNTGIGTTANMIIRAGKNVCPETGGTTTSSFSPIKTSPSGPPSNCLKRYEESLTGFSLKLAGFTLGLTNVKGLEDGGFAADQVSFALPQGIGGLGGMITGFVMHGDGNVEISGGGFELAPISIAGFQYVGLKGSFVKKTTGYEFTAGGKMPLPGMEPGTNSSGISASVTIRTNGQGGFGGAGVQVSFTAGAALPGIPIGSTGMELRTIGGLFDLNAGTVQIGVTIGAATISRLPLPPPANLPLAKVDGNLLLQVNPFLFSANAQLTVIIFNVASASINIGDGQGFSGNPGMNVSFSVTSPIVQGGANLRVGKVTVNGVVKRRYALSAFYNVGIPKRRFGVGLPPFDINLFNVSFAGGQFKDNRNNPPKETAGMLGTVSVGPFSGSLFVDFSKTPGSGSFVDLVNKNKFTLIDSAGVRRRAAAGEAGFVSRAIPAEEARQRGLALSAAQSDGVEAVLQESIPFTLPNTTTLVMGIEHMTGSPTLGLRLPDNSVLSESVNNADQMFMRTTDPISGTDAVFVISGAAPGVYTLLIDNAPADYTNYAYELNAPPSAGITAGCSGSPASGVTVVCAPGPNGGQVDASWTVTDTDTANVQVSVGYVEVTGDGSDANFLNVDVLDDSLGKGSGAFVWNLNEAPTGKYRMAVIADDGQNPPTAAFSGLIIDVTDQRPPAVPSGLAGTSQAGELLVKWNQNIERDLAGYEIGFGVVNDGNPDTPGHFVYTRDMGPKEVITGTSNIVDAKLWGLDDNVEIYYSMRAYDISGNFSDWAPNQTGKPWPLSPDGWLPAPNSTDVELFTRVEVAFNTGILTASLESKLTLLDESNAPVPGTFEFITNLAQDKVVGLSFIPDSPLSGEKKYTVVVAGGAQGITAEDSRQMSADYRWTFTTGRMELYLPAVVR